MATSTGLRAVLQNREFALLWSGQTISNLGDGIVSVALPLLVLQTTGSAAELGAVVSARLVPTVLFLLLGGAISDRVSRRLAMLTSDGSRAVITTALGVLALTGHLNFVLLLTGAVLFGTFDALFFPAVTALYPELLRPDQLMAANSLRQSSTTIAGGLLGPLLGGVIASTIGTSWSLIIDAATFVVSASCLMVMKPTARPTASGHSMVAEIVAGLNFCRRTPWIAWTLIEAGLANALIYSPIPILLVLLFKRSFHATSWQVGVVFAAFGLGGFAGALLVNVLPRPVHRVRTMWLLWTASNLLVVLYGLAPSVWVAIVVIFLIGPLLMSGQIIWESLLQSEVPREMMGRVSSVDWMVSLALSPIGVAVAGVLAGVVNVRWVIVVPAVLMGLLATGVLLFVRSLTAIDRRDVAALVAKNDASS